ncbi:MAG: hypothetical protein RLZZ122_1166 [Actinomycetota bacterium]
MARTKYFEGDTPRLFAHRGLHLNTTGVIENSLQAFQNALEHGATHIESDVHATKDQLAVLFHDADLLRTFNHPATISDLTLNELLEISNSSIPTLKQALTEFPNTRWNLDLKSRLAIAPTVAVIEELQAHDRVLVSSFSDRRRKLALSMLSKPVATSAGSSTVLLTYLSHKILGGFGLKRILKDVDALQIPVAQGPFRFADEKFIKRLSVLEKEVHFWTINDLQKMTELIELGAHGIVSDRVDLFPLTN